MTATLMDGEAAAAAVLGDVAREVGALERPLGFATVVVSDDETEHGYAALKHAAAREVGIEPYEHRLPGSSAEGDVLAVLARLTDHQGVDGIFVQLPLPAHVDAGRVLAALDPAKDVDGLHPANMGRLLLGVPAVVPATALAILDLLDRHRVALEGSRALVVGRSRYAGLPTALLLLAANATVTACEADLPGLRELTAAAEVLVAVAGTPGLVTPDHLLPGAVVVDASPDGAVDPAVVETAGLLAPATGGVGPLTVAMLLRNTVHAARARR